MICDCSQVVHWLARLLSCCHAAIGRQIQVVSHDLNGSYVLQTSEDPVMPIIPCSLLYSETICNRAQPYDKHIIIAALLVRVSKQTVQVAMT